MPNTPQPPPAPATTAIRALAQDCDALLICAGAGMGVDSGLPDFRGDQGFWNAYPALGEAGLRFVEVANPATFAADPTLAWGFYGHRLQLYRQTRPHAGFGALLALGAHYAHGSFVFTSNVDGQFQQAGFASDRIVECHGSIHHLQCSLPCSERIWSARDFEPDVDTRRCRLRSALPRCPHCGAIARPNILMFGDPAWVAGRTEAQEARLARWQSRVRRPLVVELGAGLHVPTVRLFAEGAGGVLLRINPRDAGTRGTQALSLPMRAAAGIERIAAALRPDHPPRTGV
ncbi:MAG: hypothetical protein PHP86_18325 [Nevskiales bacterium]|nr:hypothetical protein [Nevskiales bacterium]